MLDTHNDQTRRREVQCFWAGIVTAIAVAAYRLYVTASSLAREGAALATAADIWMTNGFILWSLTLFLLAWLFWRDARRRQDELATVMRSIVPDVLLVTDAAGRVWMCNPAVRLMFGYDPRALRGLKTDTLFADRPVAGAEREVCERLRQTGYEVRPATGIRKDGARFPVEITSAGLLEQKGSVMLVRDVTERRHVEQLRENLTHLLVHDLRNPLFGITGNLHLVLPVAQSLPPDAQDSIRVALDFVRDMGDMLHCLTDVSRLEGGEWPLRPAACDVSQFVDKALAPLASLMRDKRQTAVWTPSRTPFHCDPELIERVILHLLRNAVEATASGGRIEIRIERSPEKLRVSVRDGGPGIPREFQPLVFEKFGQTPDGRKARRRSHGLGLAFCKLAIEAHGGTIGVESEGEQGNTFWFELPVDHAAAGTLSADACQRKESKEHT